MQLAQLRWMLSGFAIALMFASLAAVSSVAGTGNSAPDADPAFERTWARTDKPVADGAAARTWMWGPSPFTDPLVEEYDQAPEGRRTIQYYDKSRMEITLQDEDAASDWYVTNGLLVTELVSGQMQVGDDRFEPRPAAAINIAGDLDDPTGPVYASIADLRDRPALPANLPIVWRLARDGIVSEDSSLATYGVTATEHVQVPGIDHRIADVFWAFMTSNGTVYTDGSFQHDALFPNAFYATGYPIAEAYWTTVRVDGVPRDVLLQCFQRRCLTFTPSNSTGWQIEAGNVGLHYHQWRYPDASSTPTPTPTPTVPAAGTPTTPPGGCDSSYPGICIPPPPPDLNCSDLSQTNIVVLQPDPHNLDPDNDGVGCEAIAATSTRTGNATATSTSTGTRTPTSTASATRTSTATRTLTPTPTATPTATLTATPTNTPSGGREDRCLSTQEFQLLQLINAYRDDNGLSPLTDSTQLNVAAYRHSRDMGGRDYFSHDTELPLPPGQEGPSPQDRIDAAGYTSYTSSGENIAAGNSFATAQAVFDVWKDSPSHDAVMLNASFTQIGIGLVSTPGSTYTHYWTTDFANGNDRAPGC